MSSRAQVAASVVGSMLSALAGMLALVYLLPFAPLERAVTGTLAFPLLWAGFATKATLARDARAAWSWQWSVTMALATLALVGAWMGHGE